MFVVRYLMAALATIVGALVWGLTAGFSLWQSLGMAFLAVFFLQMLILAYVVISVGRATRPTRNVPAKRMRSLRNQLFILPK